MSLQLLISAYKDPRTAKLSRSALRVLWAMCDRAREHPKYDHDHVTWVTVRTLAEELDLGRMSVQRGMSQLEEVGLVERVGRRGQAVVRAITLCPIRGGQERPTRGGLNLKGLELPTDSKDVYPPSGSYGELGTREASAEAEPEGDVIDFDLWRDERGVL